MSELTSQEVAKIFGVTPGAVSHWRKRGLKSNQLARRYRRGGYRYCIADVLVFAKTLDDGVSEQQVRDWYRKRQQEPA